MRIDKENSAGLIIDMQKKLFPHIKDHEQLEKNINILIKGLQVLDMPVLCSEQYKKGLGETIPSIKNLLGDQGIEKTAFSCCDEPALMDAIANTGKKYIIIAGIETHVCILQTVLDLREKGYIPVLIQNCSGSRFAEDKNIALERIKQSGAVISSYESVLLELCRVAGTDTFKAISGLIK